MSAFVTCFYDLEKIEKRQLSTDFYFNIGLKMIKLFDNINFIMYIDQDIHNKYIDLFKTFKNLKTKVINFEDLEISKICDGIEFKTPKNDSMKSNKDTYNFMKIMLNKTYFLDDAMKNNDYKYYTWIDFGILKIIKETEYDSFYNSIIKISKYSDYKIKFPSCENWITWYSDKNNHDDYIAMDSPDNHIVKNNPSWMFLGGLLVGSKDALNIFIKKVDEFIKNKMIKNKYIIWEVNVWSYVYLFECRDIMEPYFANDHNINMFTMF